MTSPARGAQVNEGEQLREALAERVRAERERRAMSQAELARRAGLSKGTLSAIEAGSANPTLQTIGAIAQVFGVQAEELVGDTSVLEVP